VGVFLCDCNGQISNVVDMATIENKARMWKGVAFTQRLAQSCSIEASDAIYQAIAEQNLNRVVLAACSCCATDQVCFSCSYQRIRCKDNLLGRYFDRGNPLFEFVNIREECAWVHADNPHAATATASAMVAAAVAKTRLSAARTPASLSHEQSVLIVGSGQAGTVCQGALSEQQIQAVRLRTVPSHIRRMPGYFAAQNESAGLWRGSALILAPRSEQEYREIAVAFNSPGRQPRAQSLWGCPDTHRPGVFICDPVVEPTIAGMAAAARAAAWLGYERPWPGTPTYQVDPARCRGCGDCVEICEFGAIQLQGEGDTCVALIDPLICQGDGTCAVRCPTGAIQTGHPISEQIEAMLEAILA
jgi:heterodisulfide reductase subunit A-like polyferredoxin